MFRKFALIFMIFTITTFMGCANIAMVANNPFPDSELSHACQGQPLLKHTYSATYDGKPLLQFFYSGAYDDILIAKCGSLYFIYKDAPDRIQRSKRIVLNKSTRMLVKYDYNDGFSLHSYAPLLEAEFTRGGSIHKEKWHDFDDDITKINVEHIKILWRDAMLSADTVPIIRAYQGINAIYIPGQVTTVYLQGRPIHDHYVPAHTRKENAVVSVEKMLFRLYYASFSPDTIKKEQWFKRSIEKQTKFIAADIPYDYFPGQSNFVIAANTLIQPRSTLEKFAADFAQIGTDYNKQNALWCKYLDVDKRYCDPK
jgi:hypothetical protein